MSLSALPTALLIPPINLLPLGLAGVALASWSAQAPARKAGRVLVWLALGGLLLFSLPVTSGALIASLETGLVTGDLPADAGEGAIVILSGDPAHGGAGGLFPGSGIGALTLERMRAGALLSRVRHLPVLVSGGVLETGAVPIATTMAASLDAEFATSVRWVEDRSVDTWENAGYSTAMLRRDGIRRVFVVTHAWHMRRALMAFAHFGMPATPAPVRLDRWPQLEFEDFVPSVSALRGSYFAIHEWIGCAYYSLHIPP